MWLYRRLTVLYCITTGLMSTHFMCGWYLLARFDLTHIFTQDKYLRISLMEGVLVVTLDFQGVIRESLTSGIIVSTGTRKYIRVLITDRCVAFRRICLTLPTTILELRNLYFRPWFAVGYIWSSVPLKSWSNLPQNISYYFSNQYFTKRG